MCEIHIYSVSRRGRTIQEDMVDLCSSYFDFTGRDNDCRTGVGLCGVEKHAMNGKLTV